MDKQHRFMLVDDDETNNILCGFAIRKAFGKANIVSYTNPEDALAFIKDSYQSDDTPQTFLFLDINMPQMTGWEFLEEFKMLDEKTRKKFVIYIMSSSLDIRDREKSESIPLVSGYLSKPLSADRLKTLEPLQAALPGL